MGVVRMWEAVVADGRLAEAEAAVREVAAQARAAGVAVDAYSDGTSRLVLITEGGSPAYDSLVPERLLTRAHAWTFSRL